MKTPAKSLTRLVLGTVVGIGVISLLPSTQLGSSHSVNPLEDFETQERAK